MTAHTSMPELVPSDRVEPRSVQVCREIDVGKLFDEHAVWMRRVAYRLTGCPAAADDVVQEVFCLVHGRRHALDDRIGIRTWLYRAVVNVARHRRRSHLRHDRALARSGEAGGPLPPGPEALLDRRKHAELVRACVDRLSDIYRDVFVLFELEEIGGAEIALILEIPENTVWSRLRIGRELFRAEWRRPTGGAP